MNKCRSLEDTMTLMRLPALPDDFYNFTIGFDRHFDELVNIANQVGRQKNYPPHNIRQVDDTHYVVELAVAGFSPDDVVVSVENHVLTVVGTHSSDESNVKFIHRGLGLRSFEKTFSLAENVEVRDVVLKNGMLSVHLELIIPEKEKKKLLTIRTE